MFYIRPGQDRGHANFGWLDTWHSFSFGHYFDPGHMGFGPLRVINDDRIAPGGGFGEHGHRDMEIVTVVLEGKLAHKDSMGNGSAIGPAEVQRMTAGTGIRHSEFNGSETAPVHLLQIWLLPEAEGLTPGYEEKQIALEEGLNLLASRDARDGSLLIHQQADLYRGRLSDRADEIYALKPGHAAYFHVISGNLKVNGVALGETDGLGIEPQQDSLNLTMNAAGDVDFLLFDMNIAEARP